MTAEHTVKLRFQQHAVEAETHANLSAIHTDDPYLWIAGDETATVERLTREAGDGALTYSDHRTFPLADLITLPGTADDEVDVEGMTLADDFLWVVGSHSAKRKKVKPHQTDAKSTKRLGSVSPEPARRVLARIAIEEHAPVARSADGRRSLGLGAGGVYEPLVGDRHLGPFLDIPGKDNGLDIEGIAVHGYPSAPRVFLGLRGPVLRGWATVLELAPRADGDALVLADLADGDPYRKHFLDLDGLGIRDLCEYGDDLLILAGPSMDLDGPVRVYRWRGAAHLDAAEIVHSDELEPLTDLQFGDGDDHAEGIALLPGGRLLVVYDSPSPARLPRPGDVLADVVALP